MKKLVKSNVWWIGKNDWELRAFHGHEYSTHLGSSYNSYLVQEEKTFIIDTVYRPFSHEFVENLAKEIDLKKIDFIVCNHAEPDHSGALPELLALIPKTPVYCTKNGIKSIKGHYHEDWNFVTVETGDKIPVGNGKDLVFIQAPMLHWPDSMFCYLTGDNILFSNDAFGQHYCTELLFNDKVDQAELWGEAMKYYANILNPFSKLVIKKIDELVQMKVPVDMICPSHGVIWREDPLQIVRRYAAWADCYMENQVTIVYDTMYDGTRLLAENIANGIHAADPDITIRLYNSSVNDKTDIITEIFRSKAVLIGSPVVNSGVMHSTAGLLDFVKGLKFTGKKAASFGCYGWHDAATKIIETSLKDSGFEIISESLGCLFSPDPKLLESAVEYGKTFATKLKEQ